ncbi:biofilm regulation phosphoprotein SiaC [Oceanisphaera sp. IT1-181]|uniref:biofilm regulation phosphoprotein SiaC n=1 Tax=Oceanisphaera sp. IT1-181 TaxID=3081199 RepID=UPI0029CA6126|nr:biofilm regulation phosphoprotein SiaC [Oceanisphaera sp. IT1-181]
MNTNIKQDLASLNIIGSQSTPTIVCDVDSGVMSMQGDSYPENSFEFFAEIITWVEDFLKQSPLPLRLDLHLIYMNTSSVKAMMDIFDMLEAAFTTDRQVSVRWYYDPANERVVELAEEFKEDCTFPFDIEPHD